MSLIPIASDAAAIRRDRRGFVTLGFVLVFIAVVTGIALVLNWMFLVLVHQSMQQNTDAMALSAVQELLDENILFDLPRDQNDDLIDAQNQVDAIRQANNAKAHNRLHLDSGDLMVSAARVEDVTQPADGANFEAGNPTTGDPQNSLYVEALRDPLGSNPVQMFIRGLGGPDAVEMQVRSLATLDSRVVGFAPTVTASSPVVPLAIESDAWFIDRVSANDDSFNANGRRELDIVLKTDTGTMTANGALIGLDGVSVNFAVMPTQITDGVFPADLGGPQQLGPAPVALPGTQNSPANPDTANIVAAFNSVATSADKRRVFPIYTTFGGSPVTIVGFVAGDVLDASDIGTLGNVRIRVRVEPVFIVHFTAITDPSAPENPYIHKIRLSQ
jgi:hypothetical protein